MIVFKQRVVYDKVSYPIGEAAVFGDDVEERWVKAGFAQYDLSKSQKIGVPDTSEAPTKQEGSRHK
jgi:hypothetical protein